MLWLHIRQAGCLISFFIMIAAIVAIFKIVWKLV
jgi:hypothetical protein